MVKQLQMWYVIRTREKFAIKAHFLKPWSDTPDTHITTFANQLDRHQVKYEDHGVTVTNAKKMGHFVAQMYTYDLFEAKCLDNWKESDDKSWGVTQPHFTKQYAKESRDLESNKSNKSYESSAAFRETPHPHTIETPYNGLTATASDVSFASAMEYAAAIQEKTQLHAYRRAQ